MLSRYWHTLRHLRPVQFYGRLWFRFAPATVDLAAASGLRAKTGEWREPARRPQSLLAARSFRFLAHSEELDAIGWDGPGPDKLWRYNQHYFDDLNAAGASERSVWHRALIADWVRHNPPGQGDGWEPFPTSLRIVNWVKWAMLGGALPSECLHSLAVQARWLVRRLEIHLMGNHLFANAKALIFAGCFFEGAEAERWLRIGFGILKREVPEQILGDGGHFELSTMYHALALEDVLDLCNIAAAYPGAFTVQQQYQIDLWRSRAPVMLDWLRAMCHADGEIAFFNDAAIGVAPSPAEIEAYASRMGVISARARGSRWLSYTGYARLENARAIALIDLARVGPDYLPGHAHADTLSAELSVDGHRVLVNSGTSCYGISEERLRQRGTAAHNTVVVEGQDSSEVWGGFRVARRARILSAAVDTGSDVQVARGSHNGYRRLPGRPVHSRRFALHPTHCVIEDDISDRNCDAIARFHLHPELEVSATSEVGGILMGQGGAVSWSIEHGQGWIEPATWHPRFGENVPNSCLCVRLTEGRSTVILKWG